MAKKKRKAKRRPRAKPGPEWPLVLETFNEPSMLGPTRAIYLDAEPGCMNGSVSVVRYRVTVEPIDEPEAIRVRILKLWRECDNFHHWEPLRQAGLDHGIELVSNERGKERKDR